MIDNEGKQQCAMTFFLSAMMWKISFSHLIIIIIIT